MRGLVVVETHPIQYHAPLYRMVQKRFGIPVTVVYGSDFSVHGYRDPEFDVSFSWDTNLLSGYASVFLSRVAEGGAREAHQVVPRGLGEALHRVAPDAVLVTGYAHRLHLQAYRWARRSTRPVLFRADTEDRSRKRNFLKAWGRDLFLRWFYQGCCWLLYKGSWSKEHFLRLGCPKEKLMASPYAVDVESFQTGESDRARLREETRSHLAIFRQTRVLLFSGKLICRKGPELLLKAMTQVPREWREETEILYMGEGERRPFLERLARSISGLRVHFVGFQNQTQLSRFYHAADLLVVPSRFREGWGLVVNEALGHGLPCVVSDQVGAAPDLIHSGRTGEIFRSDHAAELARALQKACELTGHSEIRDVCRETVSEYSLEKAAAGIAKAFQDVSDHGNR